MKEKAPAKNKGNSSGNKKTLVLILSIIIIFCVSAIGLFGYLYFKELAAQGKNVFNIKNVDPIIANKIAGNIIYSSEKSESANYYSPILDITFTYNQNLLRMTEGMNSVYIYPTDWKLFSAGLLKLTYESDIEQLILSQGIYNNIEISEVLEKDTLQILLFTYETTSPLEKDTQTKYLSVISKEISDDQTAYIEIREYNLKDNDNLIKELTNILSTINTDTSEIENEIEYKFASGIASLKFDRFTWEVASQSDSSLTLTGIKDNKGSIGISVSDVYILDRVKDSEALRLQLNNSIDNLRKFFDENKYNFDVIEEATTIDIGGVSFEKISVKYDYGMQPSAIETFYVSYLDKQQKQINITTKFYTDSAKDKEKIKTVLDSIQINNEDILSLVGQNVLGTSSVNVNKAALLGQASTVRLYASKCNSVTFSPDLKTEGFYVGGNTYEICSGGFGSGFVVNNEGYIVTNAHVIGTSDLDALVEAALVDGRFQNDIINDVINMLVINYGPSIISELTETHIVAGLYGLFYAFEKENVMTISEISTEIYVQGNDRFDFDTNTYELSNAFAHFKANIVDINKISSRFEYIFEEDISQADISDLALIQTENPINYPSISVLSSEYFAGQEIYVVGYPGVAENKQLVSSSALLSSTVTQGAISSIKPSPNNSYDLIHIDASVQPGNSGGPIINSEAQVVGVATYGIKSESGNYNVGVAGKELTRFLDKNGITAETNSQRKKLESALSDISLSYYSRAAIKLRELTVEQLSLKVILDPFIELCELKIANGEDKTPLFNFGTTASLGTIVIFVILILLLIVAVAFLIVNLKAISQRKQQLNNQPSIIT